MSNNKTIPGADRAPDKPAMPTVAPLTERQEAIRLANRVLDRVNADPDDDLAMLARQLLRAREDSDRLDWLDRMNAALNERYGTNYGWRLVLSPNVVRLMCDRRPSVSGYVSDIDLHDSEGGHAKQRGCRDAIDSARNSALSPLPPTTEAEQQQREGDSTGGPNERTSKSPHTAEREDAERLKSLLRDEHHLHTKTSSPWKCVSSECPYHLQSAPTSCLCHRDNESHHARMVFDAIKDDKEPAK